MNIVLSPVYSYCFENEIAEHIILHCPCLADSCHLLLTELSLPLPIVYSCLMAAAFDSDQSLTSLIHFTRSAFLSLN